MSFRCRFIAIWVQAGHYLSRLELISAPTRLTSIIPPRTPATRLARRTSPFLNQTTVIMRHRRQNRKGKFGPDERNKLERFAKTGVHKQLCSPFRAKCSNDKLKHYRTRPGRTQRNSRKVVSNISHSRHFTPDLYQTTSAAVFFHNALIYRVLPPFPALYQRSGGVASQLAGGGFAPPTIAPPFFSTAFVLMNPCSMNSFHDFVNRGSSRAC